MALGAPLFRASRAAAARAVLAHGCGLDMTRRDLQAAAKARRRPWGIGKDVEGSAILGPLTRAGGRDLAGRAIRLAVNGENRQDASLDEMIHDVPAHLSALYRLGPGDLVLTGTPAGVGAVRPGDRIPGSIDGLEDVTVTIGAPDARPEEPRP